MMKRNQIAALCGVFLGITAVLLFMQRNTQAMGGVEINVWYGENQTFGHTGVPQEWINILGNVSNAASVATLTYEVNGVIAEEEISMGPFVQGAASERLTYEGDFNIEIAYADLTPGMHTVTIRAKDGSNATIASKVVNITYESGNTWPLPTTIDWSTVSEINDVAQVVDGNWTLEADSVRPATDQIGYDRLIAIGDMTDWTDYEVVVPITIHSFDPVQAQNFEESGLPGGKPGVGIMMRWLGHNDDTSPMFRPTPELLVNYGDLIPYSTLYGVANQPLTGWQQHGVLAWYRWFGNSANQGRIRFTGNYDEATYVDNTPQRRLTLGTTYLFKVRAVSITGQAPYYTIRVWEEGTTEPDSWDVLGRGDNLSTDNGSLLLVAHKIDASFGDVTVTPITDNTPTVDVDTLGNGNVVVSPNPNGGDGGYIYGTEVTITAVPGGNSTFLSWTGDLEGEDNSVTLTLTDDLTATAVFSTDLSGIISDDFNFCGLRDTWTFVNPLSNASLAYDGEELLINVPGGATHQPWEDGNSAPRIMQPANDENLDIVAKFSSMQNNVGEMQGILIEEGAGDYIRVDINRRNASNLRIYVATFTNNNATQILNQNLGNTAVPYLGIVRNKATNEWTVAYSTNGTNWQTATTFTHAMSVSSVGVFAGNVGSNSVAWTSSLDYFFTSANPIFPEDANNIQHTITTNVFGQGTVTKSPNKAAYSCGEQVFLNANPATGWQLESWGGAASGNGISTAVTVTGDIVATATFVEVEESLIYLPFITR